MPIYSMQCEKCGAKFEYLERSISNPKGPERCENEKCKSKRFVRDFGDTNVTAHLKGAGFYKNDYDNGQEKVKYLMKDDDPHAYTTQNHAD